MLTRINKPDRGARWAVVGAGLRDATASWRGCTVVMGRSEVSDRSKCAERGHCSWPRSLRGCPNLGWRPFEYLSMRLTLTVADSYCQSR